MKTSNATDLEDGQHVADQTAGADAADVHAAQTARRRDHAMIVWFENVIGTYGSGIWSHGVEFADAGNEPFEIERDAAFALAAIAPAKPATNDVHPVRNPAEAAVRLAQVDVFATGARTQRGELGVRHRAAKCEHAAGQPRGQKQPRSGTFAAMHRREEENAAADDVGDDDRRRVERPETAFESGL